MGREVRRVPLDFNWPLRKTWDGFVNPLYTAEQCKACDGSGYSMRARYLSALWYGSDAKFRPEDRGSVPFLHTEPAIWSLAEWHVKDSPEYYGTGKAAVVREAKRLAEHFNKGWCHHLNDDDVAALVAAGRLHDLTSDFIPGEGWMLKSPPVIPTAREVNLWSLCGFGHDSINQHICVKAECARLGVSETCDKCDGHGHIWPSAEAEQAYESWKQTPPPAGDAYQVWETTSEGSPISPPCETPEQLAQWMAENGSGIDLGTPYEQWLAFIRGPGWAPSGVMIDGEYMSGVEAVGK